MDRKIGIVLFLSLIARLIEFFYTHELWWDAAVYLSMGKYIATFGQLGLWEPIRPLLWPIVLGYGYFIGINPVIWGHIWSTFFSLGIIYLTYEIAKKLFNDRTALLAAVLISFTWIVFSFNVRLYTEIPAVFFALAAYYCFLKDKPFQTGLFIGLSFLTKFPEGLLLVIFGIFYLKSVKKLFSLGIGFALITLPYFIFNYLAYGSPIHILIFAQEFLKYAGIWIFQQPWWFYPVELVKQNLLYFFAIPGIIFALKKRRYALLLLAIISLLYFSQMAHKELRFAILFLPYLAILAAYGYQKIFKETHSFIIITLLLFVIHAQIEPTNSNDFFTFFDDKEVDGEILVTHPLTAYSTEKAVTMMYYPWFNASQADYWFRYIEKNSPEYVSVDTCEGGFLCPPEDTRCEPKKQELQAYLNETYTVEYYQQLGNCEYIIYHSTHPVAME